MKIESGYMMLDVIKGKKVLARNVKKKPVKIKLEAEIYGVGQADGISIEFDCSVTKIEVVG